jgi:hypothetical protein
MALDPQFIQGPDGLTPRDRKELDGMTSAALVGMANARPRDWSRSASRAEGQDIAKAAARRAYARKVLAARGVAA